MTETGDKKAENPGYLTTQEVADRLRVTRRTVYSWITNGLLRADKAGPKIWVVSERELLEFVKRSFRKPAFTVDPSRWGKGGQRAAAPPAAPASAVQPVPPQKSPDRPAPVRFGDLAQVLEARFGPPEDLDDQDGEVQDGAWGFFEPASPSIPPAKISSKKRGGRRR